ncbi:hypothetical protein M408DRAFT_333559 [Serendipita vermifera MAFF 305830]|uniref:Uncharacterized protein n=1 Tax=Serendipita vermifera MAFF 305830 TaxID=933852 RepID=A0A0C2WV84_SERVB|nr:hypothetical protein M408DRAFT_333559 [Serendipita vermifera MAFF 305830]
MGGYAARAEDQVPAPAGGNQGKRDLLAATIVLVTVVTPWMCCTMTTTTILTVALCTIQSVRK